MKDPAGLFSSICKIPNVSKSGCSYIHNFYNKLFGNRVVMFIYSLYHDWKVWMNMIHRKDLFNQHSVSRNILEFKNSILNLCGIFRRINRVQDLIHQILGIKSSNIKASNIKYYGSLDFRLQNSSGDLIGRMGSMIQ